jgi:hypothetical protein
MQAGRTNYSGPGSGARNNAYHYGVSATSGGHVHAANSYGSGSYGSPHHFGDQHHRMDASGSTAQRNSNLVTFPFVDVQPEAHSTEAAGLHNNVLSFPSHPLGAQDVTAELPRQQRSDQGAQNRKLDPRSKSMINLMTLHAPVMDLGGNLRSSAMVVASSRSNVVYG